MNLTKEKVLEAVSSYRNMFGFPKKYKYVAVDYDGAIKIYNKKPKYVVDFWDIEGVEYRDIIYLNRYVSNTKELCFKIPEKEEESNETKIRPIAKPTGKCQPTH